MTSCPEYEPFKLFEEWLTKAEEAGIDDPNAMAVSTATKTGIPSCRMVLLKAWDQNGFVFYTNLGSKKAHEIKENPYVSLCFHWRELKRQLRIDGLASAVTDEEANSYFSSRPLQSKIGAWASKQSQVLNEPLELERRVLKYGYQFATNPPPRPDFWSGFRVHPLAIEFWQDRQFRLHERTSYQRTTIDGEWKKQRLYP